MDALYLLDTNVLVHYLRGDATGNFIRQKYDLLLHEPKPIISAVTDGEIRSLARQWRWGEDRINQMLFCLDYFDRVSIDVPDVLEVYAILDTLSKEAGVTMGKNDLWIAATARVTGATLLTTDADFAHLAGNILSYERIPLSISPRQ